MQNVQRGFFAYFGMDPDDGMTKSGAANHGHVGVTSSGLRGRVLDVLKNHFQVYPPLTSFRISWKCFLGRGKSPFHGGLQAIVTVLAVTVECLLTPLTSITDVI